MILDNEQQKSSQRAKPKKVHEWITKYLQEGELDVVTGYFTVSALVWLSRKTNASMERYRMVLGEMVDDQNSTEKSLDLLNEELTLEGAFELRKLAREAVQFLRQEKVVLKTLEPNFCHAKCYIQKTADPDEAYFIMGSSNLTEAGIGLRVGHNIELNEAMRGDTREIEDYLRWFENLWNRKEAYTKKTITNEDGTTDKVPFKEYLIAEIQKIFKDYSPKEVYYKMLFELFGEAYLQEGADPEFENRRGRLETSAIWEPLYEFQRKGVMSLIRMLKKYNGAILADAVGLGKTWQALAVIKYFEMEGRQTLVLCPKKLQQNWEQYLKTEGSSFERDKFQYKVRFHTDLQDERIFSKEGLKKDYWTNSEPKLLVIDESHNLRNDKSTRYQYLMQELLQASQGDVKILMISATPINNSLLDVRNQFKLITKDDKGGFRDNLDIRSINGTFKQAQSAFKKWSKDPGASVAELRVKMPEDFFRLIDSLSVARTRRLIQDHQGGFEFPKKHPPVNLFVTPKQIGHFESFEELFNHFPEKLSGYQPSLYIPQEKEVKKVKDERQREFFLVKMLHILLTKRLESSWKAFHHTVNHILDHHQNALERIMAFEKTQQDKGLEIPDHEDWSDEDLEDDLEQFTLGKKRKIKLSAIAEAGNIDAFKRDLKKDIEALQLLQSAMANFKERVEKEAHTQQSVDEKLTALMQLLRDKQNTNKLGSGRKTVIFTSYTTTAFYLFEELKKRGFTKLGVISGSESSSSSQDHHTKRYEEILQRFAPYTKLYREREWSFIPDEEQGDSAYQQWKSWLQKEKPREYWKLEDELDILIATDVLSEGQNLQDADLVVNYDIHWNPVRVIQRVGRIDRLGSPFQEIHSVNFWPTDNINLYLDLQGRIERRMASMKLIGAEVDHQFTADFKRISDDEALEKRQKNRMLQQMETSMEDLDAEESVGFDDFSLEVFRQDLFQEMDRHKEFYRNMPKGVFSGFIPAQDDAVAEPGIIALLGYPVRHSSRGQHRYKRYHLVYVNKEGQELLPQQPQILDFLARYREAPREVPPPLDEGRQETIKEMRAHLDKWLKNQRGEEKAGKAAKNLLSQLQQGSGKAVKELSEEGAPKERFQIDKLDLLAWMIVGNLPA